MKISRDVDGLKFVGECTSQRGFVPCWIECLRCGGRMDPHQQSGDPSLRCARCSATAREFWSEAEMDVYLAENWNLLRQACNHPTVTLMQGP